MKIQPCQIANNNKKTYSPNFKRKKNKTNNYFNFMAHKTNKDTGVSILAGSIISAFGANHHSKQEFAFNAMKHTGALIILMFGLRSLEYLAFNKK